MPLRIFKINKTKKPDDKKTVDLSDQLEKLETEKGIGNGNTEEGEKKRKKVKFFLKINLATKSIVFLVGKHFGILMDYTNQA